MLAGSGMPTGGYLALIKAYMGDPVFNELCAGLRETYFRPGTEYSLAEWHLYGSSRLGIYQANKQMATYYDSTLTTITYQTRIQYRTNGSRRFELSNHLGNVLVTVSDKRTAVCTVLETVAYYKAEIITASDYYSFGSVMENRSYEADSFGYRFSMNGQEKDDEIYGPGNTTSAEFWEYDARLGRRFNTDPKPHPSISVYACFNNNPIWFSDPLGDSVKYNSLLDRVIVSLARLSRNFNKDFKILKASEETYVYNKTNEPASSGETTTDGKRVYINYSLKKPTKSSGENRFSTLFHETKHGIQFEYGEIGFRYNFVDNKWESNSSYDIHDEVEAHDAQWRNGRIAYYDKVTRSSNSTWAYIYNSQVTIGGKIAVIYDATDSYAGANDSYYRSLPTTFVDNVNGIKIKNRLVYALPNRAR
jgi:hypothetical protein